MKKETGLSAGKKMVIGAGVAALSAATYYFFGPEGKKHQKNFKGWMIKMKADIVEKIEEAEEVSEAVYHKIIDEVAAAYVKTGKVSKEEITLYADVLKKQWKHITNVVKPVKKAATKTVQKVVTKVAKVAKKVVKK
jgi:hypothetical protein